MQNGCFGQREGLQKVIDKSNTSRTLFWFSGRIAPTKLFQEWVHKFNNFKRRTFNDFYFLDVSLKTLSELHNIYKNIPIVLLLLLLSKCEKLQSLKQTIHATKHLKTNKYCMVKTPKAICSVRFGKQPHSHLSIELNHQFKTNSHNVQFKLSCK